MSDEPTVEERASETEPELVRALEAAPRQRRFWEATAADLTRRHPEQFVVAVDTGEDAPDGTPVVQLVGTASDLAGLEAILKAWRAKGAPRERLWTRWMFASERRVILPFRPGPPGQGPWGICQS